jgi:hypothetical protein
MEHGATVVIMGRRKDVIEKAAEKLKESGGEALGLSGF